MYGHLKYETILSRMVARIEMAAVAQGRAVDTRESSPIYMALAPAAIEMAQMYAELDHVLDEMFADTQSRQYLVRGCAERGIYAYPATKAVRQGAFNIDVPIGARFTLNKLKYSVIERQETGSFKLECDTPGDAGNHESGRLVPVDHIEGLTSANLGGLLIPGEDEESTEHLRRRYFDSIDSQAFGGNVADYKEKSGRLPGVGGVKVYPAWDGGGTVKIIFTDSLYHKPSPELVSEIQSAVDPEGNHGMGLGFAPIGHSVTIEGVTETIIDVQTHITFQPGWDWEASGPYVRAAIGRYIDELSAEWHLVDWEHDPDATLIVRISHIDTRLLGVAGVLDVSGTGLNGAAANIALGADCIPVVGDVINV